MTIIRMTGHDLTAQQARAISAPIVPTLYYLQRLEQRMRDRGFPADDPLMAKATAAYHAVRELRLALHEIEGKARQYPPAPESPQWMKAMRPEGE